MREELLHFIWRYRYFNSSHLFTESGQEVFIEFPGELNTGQGPDFLRARIRINGVLREGPVELHLAASDWFRHGHATDIHYKNVILHVVWDGHGGPADIPTLVLQDRIPKLLLGRYEKWMNSQAWVPCERQLMQVETVIRDRWQRQLLLHRLYQRTMVIRQYLEDNRQHWEETIWWLMARTMGLSVNAAAFEAVGRSLPVSLLWRHRRERILLEALLLGQAGLLEDKAGVVLPDRLRLLQREYRFLKVKHGLQAIQTPVLFHRMRPANAPGVRLVQLAELLSAGAGWLTRLREAEAPKDILVQLKAVGMGEETKRSLLINGFIPLLYAYGWLRDEPVCKDKALRWLEEMGPERNAILTGWRRLGMKMDCAADSQALLELKKKYCNARRCLDCAIGRALLGR